MSDYYCRQCADALGLRPLITAGVSTPYQREKFEKHTAAVPSSNHPVQSLFDSNSTKYYEDCMREALIRGFLEVDDSGRTQVIFSPSIQSSIGSKYKWGQFAERTDTIVVAKTFEPDKVHPFTENSGGYMGKRCNRCGGSLF